MQRKIAPPQTVELRERPIPDVMRADEKMKIQLSIKMATRKRRLGLAVKGVVDEGVSGWRDEEGRKGLTTRTEASGSPCYAERKNRSTWKIDK
jgi:hypothetical protein